MNYTDTKLNQVQEIIFIKKVLSYVFKSHFLSNILFFAKLLKGKAVVFIVKNDICIFIQIL